jgi:hypothetical protein
MAIDAAWLPPPPPATASATLTPPPPRWPFSFQLPFSYAERHAAASFIIFADIY